MTNKQTFPVRIDVEFTDDDIDMHILGSGCFRWSWWRKVSVMSSQGFVGIVADNPFGNGNIEKTITYDDIRRVMGNMLADAYPCPDYYRLAKQQIMDGIRTGDFDFDADGADQIMQCATFGEVVFG